MVCQFLINNLKRGHLSNETWMLRTTEPETVKTIHVKLKNVLILPNWEPRLTTNLSHLGKHYPRSRCEGNSAAFHHKTQTGKMRVPKHTNERDPVAGLLLCHENSFVPTWSRWSTQVYSLTLLAQSYTVYFARKVEKHDLDYKHPPLPTLSEFSQVFWEDYHTAQSIKTKWWI